MLRSRIPILISLDHIRPKDPRLSLGVASIISHLSHNKIEYNAHSYNIAQEVQVYPLARNILDTIWSQYNDSKYDLMFGGFVWNEPFLKTILRELKYYDYPGRIVIAGPQVSYVEKGELEKYYPEGDVFIRGYAEQAVLELAEGKDNILGVHLANTPDKGFHTSTKLSDLSSPFLDGTLEPQHFMRWETTRGCPYSCSFCQHRDPSPSSPANKSWTKIQHSQRDRIQSEIEWFVDNNVHDLAVLDPTFNTLNGNMVLDFLERARFSGKISLQCRPERITEAFLDQVESLSKTTGAEVVLEFGVQTLDPEELLHIERVRNANTYKLAEKVLHKLALVNQRRIKHEVSLIFGLPLQTVESFQQTILKLQETTDGSLVAFPLMLLRGTPLYYQKKKFGLIEGTDIAHPLIDRIQKFIPHVVTSPSMSYIDWNTMANIAVSLQDQTEPKEESGIHA
ncbi:hypothetical protein pdam_00010362 [Pocillopora damicornis]|uniref:Radical SAM core domain-containing protein n=1 Tax=Pocillopora damicornis TaxID=46731 RepID=A0A3M6UF46_POCDA|nr:uncharacterized protein LOC113664950 [Pocillopora damicornis]XP_058957284.1 uncharacterized protein LOC131784490 [Pocillopora verrucosa]RMX52311.1 hypothetical protein pdam_00010362 [Pocillopora damicornis]